MDSTPPDNGDLPPSSSVQIKTVKMQKHLYSPVFPRRSKLCIACSDFFSKARERSRRCSSFPQKATLGSLRGCGSVGYTGSDRPRRPYCVFGHRPEPVVGTLVSPVIKVTGNPRTYGRMKDDIDFCAAPALTGNRSLEDLSDDLLKLVSRVGQGERPNAERLDHREEILYFNYQDPEKVPCEWHF